MALCKNWSKKTLILGCYRLNGVPLNSSFETSTSASTVFGDKAFKENFLGSHEGCQVPFRTSGQNRGLPLRRCHGQGPHLAKRWEPRGFSPEIGRAHV